MKRSSTIGVSRAQRLRRSSTDAERRIWQLLRNRHLQEFKFRRQHPVGSYIVDFVCLEKRLIIELDGGQHTEQAAYDAKRTADLEGVGYRVVRFWDNDVLLRTEEVLEAIYREMDCPAP